MQLNRSCLANAGDRCWARSPDRARDGAREKENLAQHCHQPKPGIAIKGHLTRATIGLQKDDHRFHRCLFVEVRVFLAQIARSRCQHPQNCTPRLHAGACGCRALWRRTHYSHLCASIWISSNGSRGGVWPSFPRWLEQDTPVFPQERAIRFGWTGASELLRLAELDRAADTRAEPGDLACVPDAPVETDASPRCRLRRAGKSGSRAHDVLANESTRARDRGDRRPAAACAIF